MRHCDLDLGAMLRPVPAQARFSDPDYYIWGGAMVRDAEGLCHLMYSRWPRYLGHHAWVTHSEIAHAVADNPLGPYTHRDVALPARGARFWDGCCTHNPAIHCFEGRYYLYYMGNTGVGVALTTLNWTHRNNQRIGVAVAASPDGPWERTDAPLITPTPGFHDALCCSNPSIARRPDGGYVMVYKAVGGQGAMPFGGPVVHVAATSDTPTGPFTKHPAPVFAKEGVHFPAEDPFIWCDGGHYWAVVKDNAGHFCDIGKSLALFESVNGLEWTLARHPLVSGLRITWADGRTQDLNSLERPQLWIENGLPKVLFCAVDEDARRRHSYNLAIPLDDRRQE